MQATCLSLFVFRSKLGCTRLLLDYSRKGKMKAKSWAGQSLPIITAFKCSYGWFCVVSFFQNNSWICVLGPTLRLQDPHKTSRQVGHSRGKANYPSFQYPRLKIHVNDTSKLSRLCKIRTNTKLLRRLFRNFSKVKVRGFSRNWLNGQRTERGNSLYPFYQNSQSSFCMV